MAFPHPRGGRAAQVRPLRVVLVLAIDRRPESQDSGRRFICMDSEFPDYVRPVEQQQADFLPAVFVESFQRVAADIRFVHRRRAVRSAQHLQRVGVAGRVRSRGLRPRFRYRPPKEVVFVVCEGIIFPCRRRCVPQCRRCRPGGRRPPLFRRRNSLFRLLPVRCRRF